MTFKARQSSMTDCRNLASGRPQLGQHRTRYRGRRELLRRSRPLLFRIPIFHPWPTQPSHMEQPQFPRQMKREPPVTTPKEGLDGPHEIRQRAPNTVEARQASSLVRKRPSSPLG